MADIEIGAIVWGVQDVYRAVDFWTKALGYRLKYPAKDDWAILVPESGQGIQLSINRVTSLKARRHHIDLFAQDREKEVKRLLELGAKLKAWNYDEDADYTVLTDPEGNPFCVVQI